MQRHINKSLKNDVDLFKSKSNKNNLAYIKSNLIQLYLKIIK